MSEFHVAVTGSEKGTIPAQREKLLKKLEYFVQVVGLKDLRFHFGDCRGVDTEAFQLATSLGIYTIAHPGIECEAKGKRTFCQAIEIRQPEPNLVRNRTMVNESSALLAVPSEMHNVIRSGTWYTYRYAKELQKFRPALQTYLYLPILWP